MAKSLLSFNISNLTLNCFFETFNRGTTTIIFETLKVKIYSSKLFKGATLIPDTKYSNWDPPIIKRKYSRLFIRIVGRIISFASVV